MRVLDGTTLPAGEGRLVTASQVASRLELRSVVFRRNKSSSRATLSAGQTHLGQTGCAAAPLTVLVNLKRDMTPIRRTIAAVPSPEDSKCVCPDVIWRFVVANRETWYY